MEPSAKTERKETTNNDPDPRDTAVPTQDSYNNKLQNLHECHDCTKKNFDTLMAASKASTLQKTPTNVHPDNNDSTTIKTQKMYNDEA